MTLSEFLRSTYWSRPFSAVLGHPVAHSLSPKIHNAALEKWELDVIYYAIDCPEQEYSLIPELLASPYCHGVNVTIPLKREIMQYLDELDESARAIGAVNTIVPKQVTLSSGTLQETTRTLLGYNTDAYGFIKPLETYKNLHTATVLGSGGASKAVRYALKQLGVKCIYMVSRSGTIREESPQEDPLTNATNITWISYSDLHDAVTDSQLLVNTTPVGMYPNTNSSPVSDTIYPLLRGKICYDIIYNPLETMFLSQAKQHGAETVDGLNMFIYQASRAFELWFHKPMPVDLVRGLVLEHISLQ